MAKYTGGCLCGNIRYKLVGKPIFPHFCSCYICQRWSGAPAIAWVDFLQTSLAFDRPENKLTWYRTCETTQLIFSECTEVKTMEKRVLIASWLFLIGSGLFMIDAISEIFHEFSLMSLSHFSEGMLFLLGSMFFMPESKKIREK